MYELFEHTADLGLRVRAGDLDTLFREAAEGLFSMIVEHPPQVRDAPQIRFRLAAQGYDYLLFDWLAELLYTFESERLLLAQFEVHVAGDTLQATARGLALDPSRQRLLHEVKAITYHGLRVERSSGGWLAEVVVDI